MSTVREGEIGTAFRLYTFFNMSQATNLTIKFTKPDGTTLQVSSPDVTAPGVSVTDPKAGTVPAYEYMQYLWKAGDLDQSGVWRACGTYQDATTTIPSDTATFTVEKGC
jgi:hypothetical protein